VFPSDRFCCTNKGNNNDDACDHAHNAQNDSGCGKASSGLATPGLVYLAPSMYPQRNSSNPEANQGRK
jgi:hypothetical protein